MPGDCNTGGSAAGKVAALGFRKILGPYNVLRLFSPVPQPIGCTFPFSHVAGGQVAITVDENINNGAIESEYTRDQIVTIETELVGIIQGTIIVLKRQHVRGMTGPMLYRFEDADFYETIEVRARTFKGGCPFPEPTGFPFDPQDGFYARMNVSIQPRG